MTYAIIILSVLVVILLVRSVNKSQLDKLEAKLQNNLYQFEKRQARYDRSILEKMSFDRRNVHDHMESVKERLAKYKETSKTADNQLLSVLNKLANKSGYVVHVVERDPVPAVEGGEEIVLALNRDELVVNPKKTVTYRKK